MRVIIEDLLFQEKRNNDNNFNRQTVKNELLKLIMPTFSFYIYKKNINEKIILKKAKKAYKEAMLVLNPNYTNKSDYYRVKVKL